MFLRSHHRTKDGKDHSYWSLVETVRTADGPRQRTLCYLGELNGSAQARWLKAIEVFNEQGESHQLKLFPSDTEPPVEEAGVARGELNRVRLERARRFGEGWGGLELWRRLGLDGLVEARWDLGDDPRAEAWWREGAALATKRLTAAMTERGRGER